MKNDTSEIFEEIIVFIYPFIMLFGVYIVLNGHLSPGGGFQGGAVLAALFMCRYLVNSNISINTQTIIIVEKVAFIIILLLVSFVLITSIRELIPSFKETYLILMNILIGIKVSCGLSIVFFAFAYLESR